MIFKLNEEEQPSWERLTVKPYIQSQDNLKFHHFSSFKAGNKPNTSKNSTVGSVNHSIQSPLSRRLYGNECHKNKKSSIGDESTNASNFQGRITNFSKFQNRRESLSSSNNAKSTKKSQNFTKGSYSYVSHKQIKKVISIPSVSLDKKAVKQSKKANYYNMMDVIPENQDFSEIDSTSIVHQPTSSKHKSSTKNDESDRKVVISKMNKSQNGSSKSKHSHIKVDKNKIKKTKKPKFKVKMDNWSYDRLKKLTGSDAYSNVINNEWNDTSSINYGAEHQTLNTDQIGYTNNDHQENVPIQAEIEYNPSWLFDDIKEDQLATPIKEEWENIEMFNSKKFSDIIAKQNSRYENRYIDKEDSYIDIKNSQENDPIQVIGVIDKK